MQLESYLADIPRVECTINKYIYHNSCVPLGYSYSLNGLAFALGFRTGFHRNTVDQSHNATYIHEWLTTLSRQFSLVIVVEYFTVASSHVLANEGHTLPQAKREAIW